MYTCMHIHTYTYTYTWIYIYTYKYILTKNDTYINIKIKIYIYIYPLASQATGVQVITKPAAGLCFRNREDRQGKPQSNGRLPHRPRNIQPDE